MSPRAVYSAISQGQTRPMTDAMSTPPGRRRSRDQVGGAVQVGDAVQRPEVRADRVDAVRRQRVEILDAEMMDVDAVCTLAVAIRRRASSTMRGDQSMAATQ